MTPPPPTHLPLGLLLLPRLLQPFAQSSVIMFCSLPNWTVSSPIETLSLIGLLPLTFEVSAQY